MKDKVIRSKNIGLFLDSRKMLHIDEYYKGLDKKVSNYIFRSVYIKKSEIPRLIKNLQEIIK